METAFTAETTADDFSSFGSHFLLQSEIKTESPVDIVDEETTLGEASSVGDDNFAEEERTSNKPKISLTPTEKLLATPNSKRRLSNDERQGYMENTGSDEGSNGFFGHGHRHESNDGNNSVDSSTTNSGDTSPERKKPTIRLTPTAKLLAKTNPVDPKRKFVCPYENCTKSYGKSSHLRSHLTWHTGVKPFVCKVVDCGKGFTRSDELNRHIRTHTGEKPFECIQCTKKFSRSDHLTKHLATHAKQMANGGVSRRSTPRSPRVEKKRDFHQLLKDMQEPLIDRITLKPVDSSTTTATTTAVDASETTENVEKPNESKVEETAPADDTPPAFPHKPIKIKLEKKSSNDDYQVVPTAILKSDTQLGNQIKNDEDSEMIVPAAATMLTVDQVQIKAEPTEMNDDDIMPEANAKISPKRTPVCSYPPMPSPERPFPCQQCEKSFRRQDDLNRHMRTHTGEKPYECNECSRRFMRSDHLKKHMNTHVRLR